MLSMIKSTRSCRLPFLKQVCSEIWTVETNFVLDISHSAILSGISAIWELVITVVFQKRTANFCTQGALKHLMTDFDPAKHLITADGFDGCSTGL